MSKLNKLPLFSLFNERRDITCSIRTEELNSLTKKGESHGSRWKNSTNAFWISPSIDPI